MQMIIVVGKNDSKLRNQVLDLKIKKVRRISTSMDSKAFISEEISLIGQTETKIPFILNWNDKQVI